MTILTKSDIKFDELRLSRVLQPDDTYKWYVNVGYKVLTAEGEEYNRDKQVELTGTRKTAAINFLTDLYNFLKAGEGI